MEFASQVKICWDKYRLEGEQKESQDQGGKPHLQALVGALVWSPFDLWQVDPGLMTFWFFDAYVNVSLQKDVY